MADTGTVIEETDGGLCGRASRRGVGRADFKKNWRIV